MKLRGVTRKSLEKERPTSWDSFRIMEAHREKVVAYWHLQRLRQDIEYTLTREVEHSLGVSVVASIVKKAEREYTFTDTQMKIAMSAQERRK